MTLLRGVPSSSCMALLDALDELGWKLVPKDQ